MKDYVSLIRVLHKMDPSQPVYKYVYTILRDEIYSCERMPGEKIKTSKLAEEMSVNRNTIRSALAELEEEGLVIQNNTATTVSGLSENNFSQLYAYHKLMTPFAARLAARRRSDSDLRGINQNIAMMQTDHDNNYWVGVGCFFEAVCTASKNEYLLRGFRNYEEEFSRYNYYIDKVANERTREAKPAWTDELNKIYKAILDKDEDAAHQLCRLHIDAFQTTVINSINGSTDNKATPDNTK